MQKKSPVNCGAATKAEAGRCGRIVVRTTNPISGTPTGPSLHQSAIRRVVVTRTLPQAPRGRMSPEIEIAAKVSFFDRPFLVVAIVTTAVVVSLFALAYFGVLHY